MRRAVIHIERRVPESRRKPWAWAPLVLILPRSSSGNADGIPSTAGLTSASSRALGRRDGDRISNASGSTLSIAVLLGAGAAGASAGTRPALDFDEDLPTREVMRSRRR